MSKSLLLISCARKLVTLLQEILVFDNRWINNKFRHMDLVRLGKRRDHLRHNNPSWVMPSI